MDLGSPSPSPATATLGVPRADSAWIQPIADSGALGHGDPADLAVARETIRLAFVAGAGGLEAYGVQVLHLSPSGISAIHTSLDPSLFELFDLSPRLSERRSEPDEGMHQMMLD
jgi:hypothetical protein